MIFSALSFMPSTVFCVKSEESSNVGKYSTGSNLVNIKLKSTIRVCSCQFGADIGLKVSLKSGFQKRKKMMKNVLTFYFFLLLRPRAIGGYSLVATIK